MEFYTKHRDNAVSKFNFFKVITLALLKDYLALPKQAHFAYLITIISTYIIINNLIISYHLFYEAFCFKKKILTELGFSKLDWFWPELFLWEIPELYFIHEFSLLVVSIIWKLVFAILMIIPVLLIIAYSTLLEWKLLSAAQRRRGPNKVGIKGSAQPLIDGVKLILKEIIIPVQSENKIFLLSSIWSIFFMLLLWFIVPTSKFGNIIQLNYELLALFCVSILGSISILLAGWSSNSKYAFLGGVWAGAQMISYDLVLGLVALIVMTVTGSTQIIDIVEFQKLHGPLFLYLPLETSLFLILIVAETNRAPFDFAEAESELVSGYNTEYSGLPFAFFFIAEYGNILYMSLLTSLLFFGGWSIEFLPVSYHDNFFLESLVLFTKTVLVYFFFLWLRAALPRYRYDQLMSLCWKVFLPIALLSLAIWVLTFLNL
jgi:NADH-quinone oxidoreductase subunit H